MTDDFKIRLLQLIGRCTTCLVGSIDANGYPAIRAMLQPREKEGMNRLYFSTNSSSQHVAEFAVNDKASVYFYDPNLFQGLLVRGRMEVSTDQDLRNRIWRDGDNIYYNLGPTDPDYSVMIFTAHNGRYYEDFAKTDFNF